MQTPFRCFVLFAASAAALSAQQTFTERMNARFEERSPRVGELVRNAHGHTADGQPFELADCRGKLTVFVFGCLT